LSLANNGILEAPQTLAVEPRVLLVYGVFFFSGWALYASRDLLDDLKRGAGLSVAAGLAVAASNAAFASRQLELLPARDTTLVLLTAATGALSCWLLIFGLTGLFLRYWNAPSPRMRYLSDSAYWLFLFHPPVLVILQLSIRNLNWSAHAKLLFVLALTTPLLLLSYDLLVRPTWLGALLNGRRYPSALRHNSERHADSTLLTRPERSGHDEHRRAAGELFDFRPVPAGRREPCVERP